MTGVERRVGRMWPVDISSTMVQSGVMGSLFKTAMAGEVVTDKKCKPRRTFVGKQDSHCATGFRIGFWWLADRSAGSEDAATSGFIVAPK